MHSHGFHNELALDRHAQLLRDAGVESPAAGHRAALAADRRAESAPNPTSRLRRLELNPASRLAFALSEWRRTPRPGLSGT